MIPQSISDRILRRFTVDEYYAMLTAGILREEPGLELIDGLIVERPEVTPREASIRSRLLRLVHERFGDRVEPRVNGPLRIDEMNETEPDLILIKPLPDEDKTRHPAPRDVYLVIEIADASFSAECVSRPAIYAMNGIAEIWMINAATRAIHVHRKLREGEYQEITLKQGEDHLAPLAFPDVIASVREMIGP